MLKVSFLTETNYWTVDLYTGVASVENRLLEQSYLVVTKDETFVGILTPVDIVRSPYQLVADCLHEKPHVDVDDDLESVLTLMQDPSH